MWWNRTIPRIATVLDPCFKKDGFLQTSNAEQASKALEDDLFNELSICPQNTQQPTPPLAEPKHFSFMKDKRQAKVKSRKIDAIIVIRQHLEKYAEPENCNPLDYFKVTIFYIYLY